MYLSAAGHPKGGQASGPAMGEKGERTQTTHYMELGSYQYWPVLVPRGIRLYTYEQIPAFLRENPYITDGYRAYLPSRLCIKRSVTEAAL
ncbi:Progestin and adipoQ receptor family member 3 [Merluccius polli]|uniref:Progestin and adipoQ receptor family member 3 n=1 Tax=Merluccius polli TaxID=89951 RepID=A0AA47M8C0_MERPO|nr:Progestin and adipoQ receptor family member 3 [Merluccius polli]